MADLLGRPFCSVRGGRHTRRWPGIPWRLHRLRSGLRRSVFGSWPHSIMGLPETGISLSYQGSCFDTDLICLVGLVLWYPSGVNQTDASSSRMLPRQTTRGGIYAITNALNGKQYIGSAKNLNYRKW